MVHRNSRVLSAQHDFTASEIIAMAEVLARRYGERASEVAQHFRIEHEIISDQVRALVWRDVQSQLERQTCPPTPC